jgi:PhoH-like ATPase
MSKTFILDTNVLLHDPQAIFSFQKSRVVIPIEVIEEIDKFKREVSELGRNSRLVAHTLDEMRTKGKLGEGVALENGGTLRVACDEVKDLVGPLRIGDRVDRRIISLAMHIRQQDKSRELVVVTKDVNLRLKADALGIAAEDYETDRHPDADVYTGWHELEVAAETLETLREGRKVLLEQIHWLPNEFALLRDEADKDNVVLVKMGPDGQTAIQLPSLGDGAAGISPLNLEQTFALSAVMDDKISLVTLTGKAGTGKTLLAMAAGLHKVFVEDRYRRVLVFRPTMPVGRDIGFLPGDVSEKMQPWMQPIYDALELIREQDRQSANRCLPPDIFESDELSVEPLTYIRGRSIPRQFIIIDEAQNLTPLEVKTVVTRVGRGTKIIMTGDPHQIDNPYVDALSNGLIYLVDRFRHSELAAHVGLRKGERSMLAETAANLL